MADLRCHSYSGTVAGCQKALCEWQYLRPLSSFMLMSLNESHYVLLWEWRFDLDQNNRPERSTRTFWEKIYESFCTFGCADALAMCWCKVFKLERRIICRGCGAVVYVEIWCSHGGGCLNLACVIFLSHIISDNENWCRNNFTQKLLVYFTNNYKKWRVTREIKSEISQ